ncbi:aldo/keto reductase [Halomicrobium salinisoli]|uniref:aldo/keto reductase n=1 Tax=Halomicrobium salinisoli TaxID=2878391 RepID=UPI001CF01EC9|nr:aldo/keto reductase [Halomicrobium salinisoli]
MDLPPVGLGTMGIEEPEPVATALETGYRHLDTAQIYGNEAVVGEGLAASDVDREDVTVATKLWVDSLAAEDVRAGTEASLDRLGLDYVDLLYVHRPRGDYEPGETLPALDAVREDGLARGIGVSNFTPDQLATAREHLDAPVAANQVEFHPYYQEPGALADAREHGYPLVAYSPLIGGEVFDDPVLGEVAEKHGVSPAAVSVAWLCDTAGVVTIPKASSEAHLRANLAAADIDLDDEDVERIEGIDREAELYPE